MWVVLFSTEHELFAFIEVAVVVHVWISTRRTCIHLLTRCCIVAERSFEAFLIFISEHDSQNVHEHVFLELFWCHPMVGVIAAMTEHV